jgi:hypothetical protein
VSRPDMAELDQITGIAGIWLRRCEGQPADGIEVNRYALRAVLAASENVEADEDDVITWSAAGRKFTAEPVQDDSAE